MGKQGSQSRCEVASSIGVAIPTARDTRNDYCSRAREKFYLYLPRESILPNLYWSGPWPVRRPVIQKLLVSVSAHMVDLYNRVFEISSQDLGSSVWVTVWVTVWVSVI